MDRVRLPVIEHAVPTKAAVKRRVDVTVTMSVHSTETVASTLSTFVRVLQLAHALLLDTRRVAMMGQSALAHLPTASVMPSVETTETAALTLR